MKRSLLILLLLAACTGTTEQGTPTILVVGYQEDEADGAEGKVGLVEDKFAVSGASTDRFEFVGSRDLPAAPVSFDITDRSISRDTLVVLSRNDTAGTPAAPNPAFLSFFSLESIDPRNPTDFAETRPDIALNQAALDTSDLPPDLEFCPVQVEVSRGGRYAALLHDGEDCNISGFEAVDILDTEASPPKLLERFSVQVVPASIFLLQDASAAPDRLYYLRDNPTSVQITEVTLPSETANNPEINTDFGGDVREIIDVPSNGQTAVDIGSVRNTVENESAPVLITLFEESFVPVSNFTDASAASLGTRILTSEESRRLVPDAFSRIERVFILGENAFTVHATLAEEAADDVSVSAADAVYEPINDFVFLASEGTISIFDSRSFRFGEDSISLTSLDVEQLTNPAFITWVQAVSEAPEQNEQ